MRWMIPVLAILAASLGALVSKAPHMRLAAQLASGEIDGRRISVADFVPERFQEECISVRLGDLILEAPERATIEFTPSDEPFALWLEVDDLKCRVLRPRYAPQEDDANLWRQCEPSCHDELGRQAAACSASGQDLSLWMGARDVERLHDRLEIRPAFCLAAERVEVMRAKTLSGLLVTWRSDGRLRMVFTYFSPDNRVQGKVFVFPKSDSPEVIRAARALISTLRLEPESIARAGMSPD